MSDPRADRRAPAVAGTFYPADAVELAAALEGCFTDPRGPGAEPSRHRSDTRRIRGIVAPHAGLRYSGPVAAHAFGAVAAERPPESVLVLGVDHRGRGAPAAMSTREWLTPLGRVPHDTSLGAALVGGPISIDESAHAGEHSIEMEVIFLQFVLPHPSIVALSIRYGPLTQLRAIARRIAEAIRGRDVLVVASTDLTHYLPAAEAARKDRIAIDRIEARDSAGLYEVVRTEEISMCGVAPTTVLLAALAEEPLRARLLRYGHSGEAEPMSEVVGYASLVLEAAPGEGLGGRTGPAAGPARPGAEPVQRRKT